jgi:SAM-dependent methyltransferase
VTRALALYGTVLRRAAAGRPVQAYLVDPDATRPPRPINPEDWCGDLRTGDHGLLARCTGPTLDVGCGPGRLTAALAAAGRTALGVDVSAEAVRQARRRGAAVQHGCVFSPVAGEGTWRHVLLVDGNIGIGGDPDRLLRRCRQLLAPGGDLLVELDPPGTASWRGPAALRHGDRTGPPFPWAVVAADDLAALARASALRVLDRWMQARRWFAHLAT